jgi:hypothetical protein
MEPFVYRVSGCYHLTGDLGPLGNRPVGLGRPGQRDFANRTRFLLAECSRRAAVWRDAVQDRKPTRQTEYDYRAS